MPEEERMWDKYSICKKCGYYESHISNHLQIFGHPCPKCGVCDWECEVIAKEEFNGQWYNPLTWFNFKLIRK